MRYSSADRASEDCLVTFLSSLSAAPPSANSFRVTVKIVVEMQIFPEKKTRAEKRQLNQFVSCTMSEKTFFCAGEETSGGK
jgi:hypothetical protein